MDQKKNCIMAFDMGIHHFAWVKMICGPEERESVLAAMDCHDFGNTTSLTSLYPKLTQYLKSLDYSHVTTVLIEQQMNRMNIRATKLSVFVYAFFVLLFPEIRVLEYPAFHKTKSFGIRGLNKQERKKWAVQYVIEKVFIEDPVATDLLQTFPKKDDICDCVMMVQAYLKRKSPVALQ